VGFKRWGKTLAEIEVDAFFPLNLTFNENDFFVMFAREQLPNLAQM